LGEMMSEPDHERSALQGYFDWQVTTIMLALDLVEPLPGDNEAMQRDRRQRVEDQVRHFSLAVVPERYKTNPNLDWPAEVMMALTRETFVQVRRILEKGDASAD